MDLSINQSCQPSFSAKINPKKLGLRTEIKDNAAKYTDRKSKDALCRTLGTVIHRLNLMKRVREKLGWCTIGYADITDGETNKEIFEMLK